MKLPAERQIAILEEARTPDEAPCLLAPLTARLPPELACVAAALPIGDANGQVLDALRGGPPCPANVIVGILANDPFRRTQELLDELEACGVQRVTNWPTVATLLGELAATFEHSGLTWDEELRFLSAARQRGFRITVHVSTDAQRARARTIDPEAIQWVSGSVAEPSNP